MTATRSSSPAAEEDLDEETPEPIENEVENLVENINVEDLELSDEETEEVESEVQEEVVVQPPSAKEEKVNGLFNNFVKLLLNISCFRNS